MIPRFTLSALTDLDAHGFDAIIDARAPAEYAEDHLPGAINLPVLDNDERARIGMLYKASRFQARRQGAALIARNVALHLEGALAERPSRFRPLIYCWRGGQRSGAFALILAQIGWRAAVLEGGWRSWRRQVVRALYDSPIPAPVWLLDGNTGTGKTDLLARVASLGGQVIDLEALARHRGSVFGLAPDVAQPTQKAFEGALALALARLDPARPVLIEAESNRIGQLRLPPALWQAMQKAPRIEIWAPLAERARYIAHGYAALAEDHDALADRLSALAPFHARERIGTWQALARLGSPETLAEALMRDHYDPLYARQRRSRPAPAHRLETDRLDSTALAALARELRAALG